MSLRNTERSSMYMKQREIIFVLKGGTVKHRKHLLFLLFKAFIKHNRDGVIQTATAELHCTHHER